VSIVLHSDRRAFCLHSDRLAHCKQESEQFSSCAYYLGAGAMRCFSVSCHSVSDDSRRESNLHTHVRRHLHNNTCSAGGRREKGEGNRKHAFCITVLGHEINFVVSPEGSVAGHSSFSQLHIYYLVCWYVTKIEPNLVLLIVHIPKTA
jgi:hypothetical protein